MIYREKYNEELYEFCTIEEIAKKSGRAVRTIRKFIERGILPESNLRMPSSYTKGSEFNPVREIKGARIYTKELAENIIAVIKTFREGIPVTEKQKQEISNAFNNERVKLKL